MRVIDKDKLFEFLPKPKNDIESDYYCEISDTIVDLQEYIIDDTTDDEQMNELREAKRLLRLAVDDITFILSYVCSDEEMCCEECPTVNHACNKWRYADEAEKLLNE